MAGVITHKQATQALVEVTTDLSRDEPKRYCVHLHNDDYTPMAFVVLVLEHFFFCDAQKATTLMWQVHTTGHAACGVFTKDIAETKVALVNEFAKQHEHPLLCTMVRL